MLFWLGLVAGLIIGWIIEWVIDWRFWRRPFYTAVADENRWRNELDGARRELDFLRAQVATATAPTNSTNLTNQADPLAEINGIGPAFAQKLNAAGIATFAQLSRQTPERLIEIIQPESWQQIEPQAWIAQAATLSKTKQQPTSQVA